MKDFPSYLHATYHLVMLKAMSKNPEFFQATLIHLTIEETLNMS